MKKYMYVVIAVVVLVIIAAVFLIRPKQLFGQSSKPIAQLPQISINTAYAAPVGGTTWAVHNSTTFVTALNSSNPGDIIVLDAGVTYAGNFHLPKKANPLNKWIYIISNQLANMPEGTRVSTASAVFMPKLQSPNSTQVITYDSGANYWRLVGLEITAVSNYPMGCGTPALHCMTYFIANYPGGATVLPTSNIGFDRVYAHGSQYQDFQGGLELNVDTYAFVVDSYIDDVHIKGFDTNGVGCYHCLGPIKITNNYISASTENIIFGGSGGSNNPGVPSDITVQNNLLYKPLSWVPESLAPINSMVVKNAFEVKSGQRILFDSNIIQNVWAAGQLGFAVVLTVRSSQSGDMAVDNDITVSNNDLRNVTSFVNTLGADDVCGTSGYPNCHNAGSQDRWNIYNNIVSFYDPTIPGGLRNAMLVIAGGLDRIHNICGHVRDVLFQHNTAITSPAVPNAFAGIYVNIPGTGCTPATHLTDNIWILDNVLPHVLFGDNGFNGAVALSTYLPWPNTAPNDITARYYGNEQFCQGVTACAAGTGVYAGFPTGNLQTNTPYSFNNLRVVVTPPWTTTAGPPAPPFQSGYLGSALPPPVMVSIAITPVTPTIAHPSTQQFAAVATYSDGSQQNITASATWASSNVGTATIAAGGLATTVASGTTNITAQSGAIISPTNLLTVSPSGKTLASIAVTPASASIHVLSTSQYTAIGTYTDTTTADITNTVTWSSSVVGTATISKTGLATGIGAGATIITATYGSISGNAALAVISGCNNPPIAAPTVP